MPELLRLKERVSFATFSAILDLCRDTRFTYTRMALYVHKPHHFTHIHPHYFRALKVLFFILVMSETRRIYTFQNTLIRMVYMTFFIFFENYRPLWFVLSKYSGYYGPGLRSMFWKSYLNQFLRYLYVCFTRYRHIYGEEMYIIMKTSLMRRKRYRLSNSRLYHKRWSCWKKSSIWDRG